MPIERRPPARTWMVVAGAAGSLVLIAVTPPLVSFAAACAAAMGWCALLERVTADLDR